MDYYDVTTTTTNVPEGFWAIFAAYMAVVVVLGIVLYVYMALVLMKIAQRTNTPNGWLAWIPIANLYLMTQIAKVPWWSMLVILLAWIPVVGSLAMLGVMIWWWWKICEARNKPGWWSLLIIFIPIVNLILPGILAWGKD